MNKILTYISGGGVKDFTPDFSGAKFGLYFSFRSYNGRDLVTVIITVIIVTSVVDIIECK